MVKAGVPVFFGCDVGKSSERNLGLMDTTLYEFEQTFSITLGLTKAQRLEINESAMTHAMVYFWLPAQSTVRLKSFHCISGNLRCPS